MSEQRDRGVDLQSRRLSVLQHMTAIEAPRVLYLIVAIIVLFDIGYAIAGIILPVPYYLSDVAQSAVLIGVALLLQRRLVPDRWAPAIFMVAVVANNAAVTYQAVTINSLGGLVAAQGALGIIPLMLAIAGAVALVWRAFLIGAAVCTAITSTTLYVTMPDIWVTWFITMVTAVAVGGVVLYGRFQSALDLARAQQQVEELATVDPLTGLFNRRGLEENIALVLGHARRTGDPFFVAFIDVCGLKQVNDRYGHAIGDRLLQRVGHALRGYSRASEILCRWGGDEFLLIGVGHKPDPFLLHERLESVIDLSGLEEYWKPSLWIGSAEGTPGAHSLDQVITQADHDMYARRAEQSA